MGMKTCMNILCGTTSSAEWKSGWCLRSGELANLCDKCGYAFEQRVYCEEFHADDSGWRLCVSCGKRLHCGCIASLSLIELLDGCGVKCIGCAKKLEPAISFNGRNCEGAGPFTVSDNNVGMGIYKGSNGSSQLSLPLHPNTNAALTVLKPERFLLPHAEAGTSWISNLSQSSMGNFPKAKLDTFTYDMQNRDNYGSVAHPNLNITLGGSSGNSLSPQGAVAGEREQKKLSNIFQPGFLSPSLLSTPSKFASDTNGTMMPHMRVARPPADGRGRHQLLPRYWPRITDQELQQISGDANCTIVPLFEKVLSASDAGRIGRLVLPKACAETYFPSISQPEGLPIKIQDIKGKEWVFQFRFWPNNNSRMYVLEGVTPCIQSMQLQAGDTVTFSRMDPEGKLVMGYRKASNSAPMQPIKGSTDTDMNALSRHMDCAGGNIKLHSSEKFGEKAEEALLFTSMPMMERKKSRNIGSKSKRLLMDSQDVQELRLTWEEVQGMLRPPQNANVNVVMIEDYEFEEYEEPPVLGKSTVFTARPSGLLEQWVQCDNCTKWRRLPAEILLPPKWTCADNAWDQTRCFCSAPDELGPREIESILNISKDSRKKRMTMANRMMQEQELPGLNALANAVVLGDNSTDLGTSSVAATTKHPRHRPGCSCIVCIQPPSGKGKHKSTCTCTVCMTVKRRFKTLMMRKRKRQSDQEAEMALKNHHMPNGDNGEDKAEVENNSLLHDHQLEVEDELQARIAKRNDVPVGVLADSSMSLDLNCHPERGNGLLGPTQASLTNLLQLQGLPLEAYMSQNCLVNLASEQPDSSAAHTEPVAQESEEQPVKDPPASQALQQVTPDNGGFEPENDKQQSDTR